MNVYVAAMSSTDSYDPKGSALSDLTRHVLEKGWQAGAVVGTASLIPYAAFRHYRPRPGRDASVGAITQRGLTLLGRCASRGVPLAGVFEVLTLWGRGVDQEGIEDRAYRLHYNESQNRTDNFARSGLLVGGMIGCLAGVSVTNALGGAAFGTSVGILAHVSTWRDAAAGPNRMFAEIAPDIGSK